MPTESVKKLAHVNAQLSDILFHVAKEQSEFSSLKNAIHFPQTATKLQNFSDYVTM